MPPHYRAIHPVFHASKLTTYSEPTIYGQKPILLSPIQIKGQEEWEVEKILQHYQRYGKNKYLTQWKGFNQEEDIWESEENLENAYDKLQEYLQNF